MRALRRLSHFPLFIVALLLLGACGIEKGPLVYEFKEETIDRTDRVEPDPNPDADTDTPVKPDAPRPNPALLKSALEELLKPRCAFCHGWMNDDVALNERITPGRPLESSLYLRIEDGSMPPFGESFTEEELARISEAIKALDPTQED